MQGATLKNFATHGIMNLYMKIKVKNSIGCCQEFPTENSLINEKFEGLNEIPHSRLRL